MSIERVRAALPDGPYVGTQGLTVMVADLQALLQDRDALAEIERMQALIIDASAEKEGRLLALLEEALPNLAGYVIMAAAEPGSLWSRIHTALTEQGRA